MKINLNNTDSEFDFLTLSVSQLLIEKKFSFKMLIIKINGTLVKKDEYDTSIIHDGDKVEVIHLISGG